MRTLEEIIRRRQDELRGRPRDWRDDLASWWERLSFYDDVLWPIYLGAAAVYFIGALTVLSGMFLSKAIW